jgi:hypothetical protein
MSRKYPQLKSLGYGYVGITGMTPGGRRCIEIYDEKQAEEASLHDELFLDKNDCDVYWQAHSQEYPLPSVREATLRYREKFPESQESREFWEKERKILRTYPYLSPAFTGEISKDERSKSRFFNLEQLRKSNAWREEFFNKNQAAYRIESEYNRQHPQGR